MSDNLPFKEVRVVFNKTGAAMWFSHLDLARAVSRALRRSKLDIWMTEGFTPRPHIVFTPPLSLGYESTGEIMDFRLNLGAELDAKKLAECFPPALSVNRVYTPRTKLKEIAYADYRITLDTDIDIKAVSELFSHPVEMVKKTKRGESVTDITKFIKTLEISSNNGIIKINTTLCASAESTLNPVYLLKALEDIGADTETASVCRLGFRKADMSVFE